MKLRQLEFLVAIAEAGGVTRAAELLGLSQPTLSAAMRELEDELGCALLDRSRPTGVGLTPTGRAFLRRARSILDLCELARSEAGAAASQARRHRVAIGADLSPGLAGAVQAAVAAAFPDGRGEVWEVPGHRIQRLLDHGKADVGVSVARPDARAVGGAVVWEEPIVAIVPLSHPLARRPDRAMEVAELAGEPFVLRARCEFARQAAARLRAAGVSLDVVARVERDETATRLVAEGRGLTLAPAGGRGPGVEALRLVDLDLRRAILVRPGPSSDARLVQAVGAALSSLGLPRQGAWPGEAERRA